MFCDVSKNACSKLKNSNCFRHAHKGDFPKFGSKYYTKIAHRVQLLKQNAG